MEIYMMNHMKLWLNDMFGIKPKRAIPILSFPSVSLMGITVRDLVSDSSLQAAGMKLIAGRVPSGASVSMMDLSVEAEAFGSRIRFNDREIPTVTDIIVHNIEEARSLAIPKVGTERTGVYIIAVREASVKILDRPVFAGMIGPFSLAGRLLGVSEIMMDCYDEPELVHLVMEKASAFLIEYARAYRQTNAGGIVMAEPLTGLLSPSLAEEFSESYVRQIIEAVQDDAFLVIYHNCGNNTVRMLDSILRLGAAAYHFGNSVSMREVLSKLPSHVLAMGNLDPAGLFCNGTPESIAEATDQLLDDCGGYPNFIISSGCDIPPATPWENIDAFFRAVEARPR
jgi:uroporphyrinogen decarboxylase